MAIGRYRNMERETGFEPATSTLARSHSTSLVTPAQRKTLFLRGNITDVKRYGKVTQTKAFINLWTSRLAVLFYFSVEGHRSCEGACGVTGAALAILSVVSTYGVCVVVKNSVKILCYSCVKADELLGSTT